MCIKFLNMKSIVYVICRMHRIFIIVIIINYHNVVIVSVYLSTVLMHSLFPCRPSQLFEMLSVAWVQG